MTSAFGLGFMGMVAAKPPLASGNFMATSNAVTGTYTLNGASVTIGDIVDLTQSAPFDPNTAIDAGGLILNLAGSTVNLYLTSAVAVVLLGGYTAVMEFYTATVDFALQFVIRNSNDGSQTLMRSFPDFYQFRLPGAGNNYSPDPDGTYPLGQINRIAFTITDSELAMSINGSPVDHFDANGLDPGFDSASFLLYGSGADRVRRFDFFSPIDDTDLPSLSAL